MQELDRVLMRKYTKNYTTKKNKESIFRVKKSIFIIVKKNYLLYSFI